MAASYLQLSVVASEITARRVTAAGGASLLRQTAMEDGSLSRRAAAQNIGASSAAACYEVLRHKAP